LFLQAKLLENSAWQGATLPNISGEQQQICFIVPLEKILYNHISGGKKCFNSACK
jgi:hypothetical protein